MREKINGVRKWFSGRKLKVKVRYLFAMIIMAYIMVLLISYYVFIRSYINSYSYESNLNTVVSIGNNLKAELKNINNMSQLLVNNDKISRFLNGRSEEAQFNGYSALTVVHDFKNTFSNIASVYIFRLDGQYTSYASNTTYINQVILNDPRWYTEVEERHGNYILRINGNGAFIQKNKEPVVSFIRMINDLNTQKPIGMLVVNLSKKMFENTYKDLTGKNYNFCYYDDQNTQLCGEMERPAELSFTDVKEEFVQEKSYFYYKIEDTPFILAGMENTTVFEYLPMEIMLIVIVFLILTIIVLILLGLFISKSITTPIERLVQSMAGVKDGWFRRVSIKLPDDEIGHLKDSYNNMLVEINRLIEEIIVKEKNRQRAELVVLQEQIKPHFLYNTLETIGYLALEEPRKQIYDAIKALGSFYRRFLSKGSEIITIREEIEIVKSYLSLQKLRYEGVFEDFYEIEEEWLEVRIPKLILQPLVENALYHGVRLKGELGEIRIGVYEEEDAICLSVYDSGVGISEELLKNILKGEENKSFGLKGTLERIHNYYGDKDMYRITSEEGSYTQVVIRIPKGGGEYV